MEVLSDLTILLATKFPNATLILTVVGGLRIINKPLFSFLRTYVQKTKTTEDDKLLDKVESSRFYKWLSYVLDLFGSVKLPKAK